MALDRWIATGRFRCKSKSKSTTALHREHPVSGGHSINSIQLDDGVSAKIIMVIRRAWEGRMGYRRAGLPGSEVWYTVWYTWDTLPHLAI